MAPGLRTRLLLCLLLACAALPAAAREPALMSANGGSAGCPVVDADTDADAAIVPPGDKRAVAPTRARPAPARRTGESETTSRPPRWHSFLPGMIR